MTNQNKEVGVILPIYNEIKFIDRTINSLLSQTYSSVNIVILDNCSDDGTTELIQDKFHKRVKHLINSRNLGPENNFDLCIDHAFGEYTCIYHGDDIYNNSIIDKQVNFLNDNSDIGAVFCLAKFIDENDYVISYQNLQIDNKLDLIEFLNLLAIKSNFIICPSLMIRTDILKEIGYWDWRFKSSADLDMWIRILEKYKIGIIKEHLISHRISKKQWSQKMRSRTSKADFFIVAKYYFNKYKKYISKESINSYKYLLIKDYYLRLRNTRNIRRRKKIIILLFTILRKYQCNFFLKLLLIILFFARYICIKT